PRPCRPTSSRSTSACAPSSEASAPPGWWATPVGAATSPSRPPSSTASATSPTTPSPCATSAGASSCAEASMALWFAGMAVLVVWLVFRDPAIDYRLVAAGALLPDVVDGPWGGARLLHTLLFSASFLVLVMLATRRRRRARRRWLALPIGTFFHLVLDGMWTHTHTFWWPFFGSALHDRLPAL